MQTKTEGLIHEECRKRRSKDSKNSVCKKCYSGKGVLLEEIRDAPENCPYRDDSGIYGLFNFLNKKMDETWKVNLSTNMAIENLRKSAKQLDKMRELSRYIARPLSNIEAMARGMTEAQKRAVLPMKSVEAMASGMTEAQKRAVLPMKYVEAMARGMTEAQKRAVLPIKNVEAMASGMTEAQKRAALPIKNVEAMASGMTEAQKRAVLPMKSVEAIVKGMIGVQEKIAMPLKNMNTIAENIKRLQPKVNVIDKERMRAISTNINSLNKLISKNIHTDYSRINDIQNAYVCLRHLDDKILESEAIINKERETIEGEKTKKLNVQSYEFLYLLEETLRQLISKKIIGSYEKELNSKIPKGLIDKWKEKRDAEKKNNFVDSINYELIYYSDFTDIKSILSKGKNKKLFSDIVNDEDFKTVISKLHELEPIRIKIAHSRPITEKEFSRLQLYCGDILKIFKKH